VVVAGVTAHWALVRVGTNVDVYKNGAFLQALTVGGGSSGVNTDTLVLGSDTPAQDFDGKLQDAVMYGREFSSAEILAIYNSGLVGVQATGDASTKFHFLLTELVDPPQISGVGAVSATQIELTISDAVYAHDITTGTFSLSPVVAITSVGIKQTGFPDTILINTAAMTSGTLYTLTTNAPIYNSNRTFSVDSGTVVQFYYDNGIPPNYATASAGFSDLTPDAGPTIDAPYVPQRLPTGGAVPREAGEASSDASNFNTGFN